MCMSFTTRRRRVSLLGGVLLLTLLCSGAVAEPLLPAIDIGSQAVPDSGAASPPAGGAQNAQPAAGPAQPAAQPLGDWPGASNATPTLFDGSAAAGYRVADTTAAGPIFGDLPIQDAPYSITVVPSSLIENLQAYQPEDVWKVIPQITNSNTLQNTSGNPFAYVRGFAITQFTNQAGVAYDGLLGGAGGMFDTVVEDKERVELLAGTSGFLYGAGSVGGVINNVLKRPTATPYSSVTLGDNAGDNGFVHGDFGGPLIIPGLRNDLFGYRLNLVYQGGDTAIENQTVTRNLASAAFDFHLWDGALLQFNGAHSFYYVNGITQAFNSSLSPFPAPANPATIGSSPWVRFNDETDNGGFKFTWKLSNIFSFRMAYDYTYEARQTQMNITNTITNYLGLMTTSTGSTQAPNYYHLHSGYSFIDAEFSTFDIHHKLTAGFTGYTEFIDGGGDYTMIGSEKITNNNFYGMVLLPEPAIYSNTANPYNYRYANQFGQNYIIGDEITWKNLTILAGANYTSLGRTNYGAASSNTYSSGYGAAQITPSVAALYKVLPWFTVYGSYQQSLQNGSQVENSGSIVYTNNGQILPPYLSQQLEFGAKATVGKNLLVTMALFDINKANQYAQYNGDGTYTETQSGREDHKGIEFTATGKATEELTLFGGLTFINPRITDDPAGPWQNGQLATNVSPVSGKMYAEYAVPFLAAAPFLHGLTLIGGFRFASAYSGSLPTSYATIPTIEKLPGYSVGDVGFRYQTKVYDRDVVFRFNVTNVANAAYWQVLGSEGPPRTFLASMQVKF